MTAVFDAKTLKSKRKYLKLTQAKLVEKADTSERYIRSLETHKKQNPSALLVFRLSNILHVSMEDLIAEQEEDSL